MNSILYLIIFSLKVSSDSTELNTIIQMAMDSQAYIAANSLGEIVLNIIKSDDNETESKIKITQDKSASNLEKKYKSIKKSFLNQIADGSLLDSEISNIQTSIDLKKSQYASLLIQKNPQLVKIQKNIEEEEIKLAAKKQEMQTFKDQSSVTIDKLIPKGSAAYVAASGIFYSLFVSGK